MGSTGYWRSPPEADFTASAREEDGFPVGFPVHRWTLKPGRDDYTARALTDGERATAGGDFAPKG
ncbi:hypothetical protein [Streptomyces halstedii]|uniref:hypothetical protein n=1 Tax=Streptomyces halstedii TaxID=1944 RepID=UPI001EF1C20B|nr:hypothetical protein [Streptomyces halstedii]